MAPIKKILRFFVVIPTFRKLYYLEKLEKEFSKKLNSKDKKKLTELKSALNNHINLIEIYLPLKIVSAIFLYSSVISTIIVYLPIPVISNLFGYVAKLGGVIGSLFFIVTTFLLSKVIAKRSGDAEAIISHMISIYSNY